ncbi:MAG TPA: NAD-dependent epimerase/dehydratase family protein [Polyangia bacterium]
MEPLTLPELAAQDEALLRFYDARPVLVTGGLGFIGSTMVRVLVELGARVTVVDDLRPNYGGNRFNLAGVTDRVELLELDIGDEKAMRPIVGRFDAIFNLVGQVSHVDSMENPYVDLYTNVTAHIGLLEAIRRTGGKPKIVFAGTRGQYGRPSERPVTENARIAPIDVNGINKHAGESYHFVYAQAYGLRTTSLRLTNTYGPRHTMKTARQGVFAWFLRQALDAQEIRLFGGGEQLRDWNHVDDVAAALLMAMASPATDGEVYNLGSETPASLKTVAEIIVRHAGSGSVKLVPFPEHLKSIEIGDYIGDYGKLQRTLGWEPRISLDDGIASTVAYYQAHRDHYWQPEVYP